MTTRTRTGRAAGWALAAASGAMMAAAFEPLAWWPLAWFAWVPVLFCVRRARTAKEAANLGALAGLVFYALSLPWLVKVFGPSAAAFWCLFALGPALQAALLHGLAQRLEGRAGAGLAWALAAGVLWAGIEYFRSELWWLSCSWMALGYTQAGFPSFLQTASVWGLYGMSACLAAANAAWALVPEGRRLPAELIAGALAVVLVWGQRRAEETPPRGRPASVALVQDESYDAARLASLSLGPDARGADILVWPEYSFSVRPGQGDQYRGLLTRMLEGSRAVRVIGAASFPEREGQRMENFAWVLGADGSELGRYGKLHPIPYVEHELAPNPSPRTVPTPAGMLGIQICYDLDFEDGARRMARAGAELLVVPNLDPLEWGPQEHAQHSAMSPVRAVESGLWIARAASSGRSQLIDPFGAVRASLGTGESGVLTGTVRLRRGGTVYTAWGWLFGPACFLLTLLALAGLAAASVEGLLGRVLKSLQPGADPIDDAAVDGLDGAG